MSEASGVSVVVLFMPDRDSNGRAMRSGKWMAIPTMDGRPLIQSPLFFDDRATAVDWADRCRAVVRPMKSDPNP